MKITKESTRMKADAAITGNEKQKNVTSSGTDF